MIIKRPYDLEHAKWERVGWESEHDPDVRDLRITTGLQQTAYRQGYADAQARAEKLAEALRAVTSQLATYMESSAWEEADAEAYEQADAALQEWDAAQKEETSNG